MVNEKGFSKLNSRSASQREKLNSQSLKSSQNETFEKVILHKKENSNNKGWKKISWMIWSNKKPNQFFFIEKKTLEKMQAVFAFFTVSALIRCSFPWWFFSLFLLAAVFMADRPGSLESVGRVSNGRQPRLMSCDECLRLMRLSSLSFSPSISYLIPSSSSPRISALWTLRESGSLDWSCLQSGSFRRPLSFLFLTLATSEMRNVLAIIWQVFAFYRLLFSFSEFLKFQLSQVLNFKFLTK